MALLYLTRLPRRLSSAYQDNSGLLGRRIAGLLFIDVSKERNTFIFKRRGFQENGGITSRNVEKHPATPRRISEDLKRHTTVVGTSNLADYETFMFV